MSTASAILASPKPSTLINITPVIVKLSPKRLSYHHSPFSVSLHEVFVEVEVSPEPVSQDVPTLLCQLRHKVTHPAVVLDVSHLTEIL